MISLRCAASASIIAGVGVVWIVLIIIGLVVLVRLIGIVLLCGATFDPITVRSHWRYSAALKPEF